MHWKLWQAKLNVWQLTDFCPLILVVLLLFFYLVIYILCLLLIYFLLCAVYWCCYFVVNKNKFVATWARPYFTRRNNLSLTIALRWPWKVGVFLAIFIFFYCNPINNKWKISRTNEKYKPQQTQSLDVVLKETYLSCRNWKKMPKVEGIASVNIDRYVHFLTQLLEYFIKGYRTHYDPFCCS